MPVESTISEVSPVSEVNAAAVSPAPVTPARPRYKPAVLEALREFRHSRPWRGTVEERKVKFQTVHSALCGIYERQVQLHLEVGETETLTGNGWTTADRGHIYLTGKLSVVTLLHEWAHIIFGPNEAKACEWSVNLYQRIFRRSAARMVRVGNLVLRPEAAAALRAGAGGGEPAVDEVTEAETVAAAGRPRGSRRRPGGECPDDVGENV